MAPIQSFKRYEDFRIRALWNEDEEEWHFSVVDVAAVLTESKDDRKYRNKSKQRLKEEGSQAVTYCHQLKMKASDGKVCAIDCATTHGVLRIIQSVPSPKVKPLKLWLAQVGAEHIEETVDPEQGIDRALETHLKKGYTPNGRTSACRRSRCVKS